jgi:LCP family protein required for cell wall assembly
VRIVAGCVGALFVVGGLLAGWSGVQSLGEIVRLRIPPVSNDRSALADEPPPAPPQPARAPLRSPADQPPPFEAAVPVAAAPTPQPTSTPASEQPSQPASPTGRLTVLLMGVDQRPDEAVPGGDPGRTDSMILVSLDFDAQVASMVSIPRDGFVTIPGHGSDRVNAAYTYGELERRGSGPDLAMSTVASVFGVPVDRYALVDIHSMEEIIDTLGGITVDVPTRLVDREYPTDDYRTIVVDIPAGEQTMDGVTAVEYARMRHPDSDYGRQDRQQQVLRALRDAAMRIQTLPRLPALIPEVQQLVKTDLTPTELAQLVAFGRGLSAEDIISLPPDPDRTPAYTGPGGASYINLTPAFRTAVKALIEQPRSARAS